MTMKTQETKPLLLTAHAVQLDLGMCKHTWQAEKLFYPLNSECLVLEMCASCGQQRTIPGSQFRQERAG